MHPPQRLRLGDTIGIFSPSSPIAAEAVETMQRYFVERGYAVKVAPNTLAIAGFMAGSPQQRADDLNGLLRDPSVRMIVTSMGGAGAVHLIPLIDYAALAADPKIIVGLSNPSILLAAMTGLTGVATFHGPNGVEFGGLCPLTPFCEENFWLLVRDEIELPHPFPIQGHFQVLRGGEYVEGRLLGGNLGALQPLLGTPWEPDWKDAILFLEEYQADLVRTDAMLAHFRLAEVFDRIRGLVVAQPVACEPVDGESLEDILLRNCAGYSFPIVTEVLIGHTDDKITLPVGCRAGLDLAAGSFRLLEAPTQPGIRKG